MKIGKIVLGMASLVALLALAVVPGAAGGGGGSSEPNPAAPENIIVRPSHQIIPYSPNFVVYTVKVTDILNQGNHTINASLYNLCSGCSTGDLLFKFETISGSGHNIIWLNGSSGWIGHGVNWEWGNTSGNDAWQKLKLYVKAKAGAPQNALYNFTVWDNGVGEHAHGTTTGTTIPEFPLGIAIPAAISLGIIFLLFRRNQKK